jgi:membrane-bound ClpP family serine protease
VPENAVPERRSGPTRKGGTRATSGEFRKAPRAGCASAESIPEGAHVRVTSVDGLLLTVRKD